MSVLIRFSPPSLTAEQYDSVVARLQRDGILPADGLDYEICFGTDGNLKVSQVWDSKEQMDAFGGTKRLIKCTEILTKHISNSVRKYKDLNANFAIIRGEVHPRPVGR